MNPSPQPQPTNTLAHRPPTPPQHPDPPYPPQLMSYSFPPPPTSPSTINGHGPPHQSIPSQTYPTFSSFEDPPSRRGSLPNFASILSQAGSASIVPPLPHTHGTSDVPVVPATRRRTKEITRKKRGLSEDDSDTPVGDEGMPSSGGPLRSKDVERVGSGASLHPYSRSPELRVSHKLAERKRRKEMKELFDELRDQLPNDRGSKSSKWEILSRAVDHVIHLKETNKRLQEENDSLKAHLGYPPHHSLPPSHAHPHPHAHAHHAPPPSLAHPHHHAPQHPYYAQPPQGRHLSIPGIRSPVPPIPQGPQAAPAPQSPGPPQSYMYGAPPPSHYPYPVVPQPQPTQAPVQQPPPPGQPGHPHTIPGFGATSGPVGVVGIGEGNKDMGGGANGKMSSQGEREDVSMDAGEGS